MDYCHLCHENEAVTSDGVCSICEDKYPLKASKRTTLVDAADYAALKQSHGELLRIVKRYHKWCGDSAGKLEDWEI